MKPWEPVPLVEVRLDFGSGPRNLGVAASTGNFTFFEFDSEFINGGINPSPFRLKLEQGPQRGADQLEGLPGLLDDSLPDGWSRLVLDRFIRAKGYNPGSLRPLDRVALVGANGPGAVTYQSPLELPFVAPDIDFDTAAEIVSNAETDEDFDRLNAAMALAGSLGGARPKAHVWLHEGKISTQATPGARQWIVKFPAKLDTTDAGVIEYAYSLMARAAGIAMPATALLPSAKGLGYFAVERFDRTQEGERLHVHSLGGLLEASCKAPSLDYEALFRVAGDLAGPEAFDQLIRRMAFNVFARNRDDHVKNHSFLMDALGRWAPSPAFDVTYWDAREHQLMVGSEGAAPTVENMLEVTRAVRIEDGEATGIIDEVEAVVREWPTFAKQATLSKARTTEIEQAIQNGLPSLDGGLIAASNPPGRGR